MTNIVQLAKPHSPKPQRTIKVEVPGALAVMNKRWQEEVQNLPDRYREPEQTSLYLASCQLAARMQADWDNSDPHVYKRTLMHCLRGLLNPAEVQSEVRKRMVARQVSRERAEMVQLAQAAE